MLDYEKLGVFYLGRMFDLAVGKSLPDPLLYDARDLTTHAVCVGMTGSGKTGLCLSLLEEAAIDGIPAIAIDPKGDLGNLLLTFPELRPADFQPWIDPADAARKGITPEQLAEQTATRWREGLAEWDQEPARIARFRDAVDIAIYTPGSTAGLPLTVLRSFAPPSAAVLADGDALRERVAAAVSGLLALLGIDADPLRSREHILLSNLLQRAWSEGRSLDMGGLIREIQSPPMDKVGFLDLESFFPAKDRFGLAMSLNNLLASPGFSAWMEGEALDVQRLLYTAAGKPRLTILSISHLTDAERMFFVTILLNEVIAWMRSQSGTSSLRALLYMDEVFGYFPPTANPPSKTPMLTLLKQARAYGLGVVLATQNPVDLDYKGLSNAGTWFLGRLQTERDKARVLDGLEGASTTAGQTFDRQRTEAVLSGLGNRVFLMNNVHEDAPVVFQTRWALSYLRGPLTRDQIARLMADRKSVPESGPASGPPSGPSLGDGSPSSAPPHEDSLAPSIAPASATPPASNRPILPPGVPECFLARRGSLPQGARLEYRPALLGTARVHYVQAAHDIDTWHELSLLLPIDATSSLAWNHAEVLTDGPPDEDSAPEAGAAFAPLSSELSQPKRYGALATSLKDHLYRDQRLRLSRSKSLKQTSRPDESDGDFRARLSQAAREQRDVALDKLKAKYAPKLAALQEQIRKAEQRVEKEKAQASQSTVQAAITMGASVLGALLGRKLTSSANVGRAASGMRAAGRAARERGDIAHAEETVEALREKLANLDQEFQAETDRLRESLAPDNLPLESVEIRPKKSDIAVSRVALAWTPWRVSVDGTTQSLI
jgi:hypothetical protein